MPIPQSKIRLVLMAACAIIFVVRATAIQAASYNRETALRELDSLLADLSGLPILGLHRNDQARIFVVERTAGELRTSVQAVGLGHRQSVNLFQQLFTRFQYSRQFFDFISTRRNVASLRHLLSTVNGMRQALGLADNQYGEVIKAHLSQLATTIVHLQSTAGLDAALGSGLNALRIPLGNALAFASQGDRPSPELTAAVDNVCSRLRTAYPLLNRAADSSAMFADVMEIIGINEFLSEAVRTPGGTP